MSSADQTLKTLLVLDSARQHTAISRFHVRRPNFGDYVSAAMEQQQTTSNHPNI